MRRKKLAVINVVWEDPAGEVAEAATGEGDEISNIFKVMVNILMRK